MHIQKNAWEPPKYNMYTAQWATAIFVIAPFNVDRNTLTIKSIQSIRDEDSMWTETVNSIVRRIDN